MVVGSREWYRQFCMQLFTSFWMIAEAAAVAGNAVVVPCSPGKKKRVRRQEVERPGRVLGTVQ